MNVRTGSLVVALAASCVAGPALFAQTTRKLPSAGVLLAPAAGYSYSNEYFAATFMGPVEVSDPDEKGVSHSYTAKSGGITQSVYLPTVDDPVAVDTKTSDADVQEFLAQNVQAGATLHGMIAGHPYTEIHVHRMDQQNNESVRMRVIVVSATRKIVVTQDSPWGANDASSWNALVGSLVIR